MQCIVNEGKCPKCLPVLGLLETLCLFFFGALKKDLNKANILRHLVVRFTDISVLDAVGKLGIKVVMPRALHGATMLLVHQ